MPRFSPVAALCGTALLVSLSACSALGGGGNSGLGAEARTMTVQIASPGGATSGVSGTATFIELEEGVYYSYEISGLAPGAHGFHVHANPSCAAADTDNDGTVEAGGAAGGHLNPMSSPHGAPSNEPDMRHTGDLGNIMADDDGLAVGGREDAVLTFDDVVGHAVMVHAGADDLTSQPSGDAGGRVGCGVASM